jgi:hypothetical protein
MKTINSKQVKETLKNKGIKVLRALTYNGKLILTVSESQAVAVEAMLAEMNIMQQYSVYSPAVAAKANILGRANAAEFTCLVQL